MMLTPMVRSAMTPAPQVIDAHSDTASALDLMKSLGVRHLPVTDRDRLVGILSERDLRGARALLDHAPGVLGPPVGDLCSRRLLVVSPDDPLDEAAALMADRKVGAVLVLEGTDLVGIMTSLDVCRSLGSLVARLRRLGTTRDEA